MALYNEILEARFNRGLQKFLTLKGAPPAPQLSTEIQPTFSLPIDEGDLGIFSIGFFRGFVTVQALAAVNSGIMLRNPANSNVVARILYQTWAANTINTRIQAFLSSPLADIATAVALARFDPRVPPATLSISGTNNVATAGTQYDILLNASVQQTNISNQVLSPTLLLPGNALLFVTIDLNVAISMAFAWSERQLTEAERT